MLRFILLPLLFLHFYSRPVQGANRSAQPDSLNQMIIRAKNILTKDLVEAERMAKMILEASTKLSNDSIHSKANYILGLIHYFKGEYLISSEYYKKALETDYANANDLFASALWNNLGINMEHELEYENTLEAYLKSLNLAEKHGDSLGIYQSYINIGLIYIWLTAYAEAEQFLNKALNYFTKKRDHNHLGLCYHNLGVLYQSKNEHEKVRATYDLAINHYQLAENQLELSGVYYNKISYLINQNQFSDAKKTMDEVEALKLQTNLHQKGNMFLAKGIYFLKGDYQPDKSENYFLQAIDKFQESNVQRQVIHAYLNLSLLYARTGNTGKHEEAILKYDSLFHAHYHETSDSKIAQMRTLYEVQEKEKQIIELTSQKRRRALWLANIVIGSAIIIITILMFLFFHRKKAFNERQRAIILENENLLHIKLLEQLELKNKLRKKESEAFKLNLELKDQELIYQSLKNAEIEKLNQSVKEKLKPFGHRIQRKKDQEKFYAILQEFTRDISRDPLADFEKMFMQMYGRFYEKLLEISPDLTQCELQTCALLRMNLPSKEIASLLNLSLSTIDQRRHSIRKKLGLKGSDNLISHLICLGKEEK